MKHVSRQKSLLLKRIKEKMTKQKKKKEKKGKNNINNFLYGERKQYRKMEYGLKIMVKKN